MLICRFDNAFNEFMTNFIDRNLIGNRVLELGCGDGARTTLFYDVSSTVGIDVFNRVSPQRRDKFGFFLADATKLPFKAESFDSVVSFDVVEHIWDDEQFVNEAFRVCKNGGYVVLGTPNRLRLSNMLRSLIGKEIVYPTIHVREYTRDQFASLCEKAGFKGKCICMWLGLVGGINIGLSKFPSLFAPMTQYLLFIGNKP